MKHFLLAGGCAAAMNVFCLGAAAQAQQPDSASSAAQAPPTVYVYAARDPAQPAYKSNSAALGPLGDQNLLDTPSSVTVVPESLIANLQAYTVNDTLRYLPSVEVRDQQGFEVSRPQSRGFISSIVQNTRMEGLSIIGPIAYAAEDLSGITVLNGLGGALYGPQPPAGVFDYRIKQPTDNTLLRYTESYQSDGMLTEHLDVGGRGGPGNEFGYRVNAAYSDGEGYVSDSNFNRKLISGTFDWRIGSNTVIEGHGDHYETASVGLPGAVSFDGAENKSTKNSFLPPAIDPSRSGYGQPALGADLTTDIGLVKIMHEFGGGWTLDLGGLYESAERNLFGVADTLTDNAGNYTVIQNQYTAWPHMGLGSNSGYLNGKLQIRGIENDLTFGTNGFIDDTYSYLNAPTSPIVGCANLADPLESIAVGGRCASPTALGKTVAITAPYTSGERFGGLYHSATLTEQAIIIGDTVHFDPQWALQAVLSDSFLDSKAFGKTGALTSKDDRDGVLSPTASLIYKPTSALTTYATFANSIEEGGQAATSGAGVTVTNSGAYLSPYTDHSYEIGAKYALNDRVLLTLDGFRMTQPNAQTIFLTPTVETYEVVGTQRDWGSEFFVQGDLAHDFSVYGGVTYLDPRIVSPGHVVVNGVSIDDKLVVGVPHLKEDLALDYHPAYVPGLGFTAVVHSETERAATDDNASFAPGYATLDLGLRYSLAVLTKHHATFRFQVVNATNKFYYSAIEDGAVAGSPSPITAFSGAPRLFEASFQADY
ncbi:MAG TPA: TonB-dependent receptor [Steroidobacteraceae bacterium]|jgi:iron complex outermembrane receptor protein|nr:TonB-dependent receptor [Steroidobacteraceae bacterium]